MNKIVFLLPSLKTGGGTRVFIELASQLVKDREVTICAPNNSDDNHAFFIHKDIKIKQIGDRKERNLGKLINLLKTVLWVRKQEGLILFADPLSSILAFLFPSNRSFRFIQADDYRLYDDRFLIRNIILLKAYKWLIKQSYQYRCKYIFNSEFTYNCFIRDSKRSDVPFSLVHPALNHEIFNADSNKSVKESGITIGTIARKHPMKGFSTFIDAWKLLPENVKSKISNVIVISHDNLEEFDLSEFEMIVPSNDKEIVDYLKNTDVFISNSWWEGFGLPPLEAMACGCSVITSASGGVNEYAVDQENCLMYPPKDVDALVCQIESLVNSFELRKKIADNAILVADKFTWENSCLQIKSIIDND